MNNKLDRVIKKYSRIYSGLTFNHDNVKENLINPNTAINELELNKNYFILDEGSGYCSYYLIIKEDKNILNLIPLWVSLDDLFVESDAGEYELINMNLIHLTVEKKKIINSLLVDYENFFNSEELKVIDYWILLADGGVYSNLDKSMLKETIYSYSI